ncbi:phosphatase PAP2 family protein [Marinicellulosiphila megalodicopiae]|uniref:phosphatase PAP2 family protein n=1 Tax=Marinicellulosiphila megalodicopiae TaxID=2724896 RepID=UPI003BAE4D74
MSALETGVGLDIVLFFHSWYLPITSGLWKFMHFAGGERGFLILLPIIYWALNKRLGVQLFILIMSNAIVMNVLKLFFARPRPFDVAPHLFEATVDQSGYGLPSGHVWLSVVFVGFLAFFYRTHKKIAVLAVFWIVLMSLSRMVLGVHFLQDVILGLLMGVFGLIVFIKWHQRVFTWFEMKPILTQVLYMIVFMLLMQLMAVVLHETFEFRKSLLSASGVLIGGVLGLILDRRYLISSESNRWVIKSIKIVLGLILLIGLYVLMSMIFYRVFNDTQTLIANLIYQLRYVCLGVWVTFMIPWLFSKIQKF